MKTTIVAVLAVVACAGAAQAQGNGARMNASSVVVGGQAMLPTRDIVDNAANSAEHTTLVAAVQAAGLVETLKWRGPFTVFAPVNDAFENLPAGTVESLLRPENRQQLTQV
ncbi:MAG TPA: fasciclin domain-containing protein, partial [Longimicrobium sp.]